MDQYEAYAKLRLIRDRNYGTTGERMTIDQCRDVNQVIEFVSTLEASLESHAIDIINKSERINELENELEALRSSYAGVTASNQTLYHVNDDLIKESTRLTNKVCRMETLIDGIAAMAARYYNPETINDRIIERIRLYQSREPKAS
jgi:hypothetical protein